MHLPVDESDQATRRDPVGPAVELQMACNVRDAGGWRTTHGRTVCRGLVYRGDSLHRLNRRDRGVLGDLGIVTVVDLRSDEEVRRLGYWAPSTDRAGYLRVPLRRSAAPRPAADDAEGLFDLYCDYLVASLAEVARIFTFLADARHLPVLFHCFAGKDRTGLLAALLLSFLGVPDAAVAVDYAASAPNVARLRELAVLDGPPSAVLARAAANASFLDAAPETITDFLAWVRDRFGSVDGLLVTAGVSASTMSDLRDVLLTD